MHIELARGRLFSVSSAKQTWAPKRASDSAATFSKALN